MLEFKEIKDKAVLVTGANSGIGASIATLFGEYGAHVGVHYKSNKTGAEKIAEIINKTGRAFLMQGDLLKKEARESLVDEFVKEIGRIDILVNNAGAVSEYTHFSKLEEKEWERSFNLHAKAPFFLMKKTFEYMKKSGGGRIINISTGAIKHSGPNNMHYYSAKSAMEACSQGFAKEGAEHNILVNTIRCGLIDTPMRTKIIGYSEKNFQDRIKMVPLKRAGNPLDIARMVLFLSSKAGDFITGQVLNISGGE